MSSLPELHPDQGLFEVLSTDGASILEALREMAAERGKTPAQVALNWVLSHPEVTVAISGSDTVEQIAEDKAGIIKSGSVAVVGPQPLEQNFAKRWTRRPASRRRPLVTSKRGLGI